MQPGLLAAVCGRPSPACACAAGAAGPFSPQPVAPTTSAKQLGAHERSRLARVCYLLGASPLLQRLGLSRLERVPVGHCKAVLRLITDQRYSS